MSEVENTNEIALSKFGQWLVGYGQSLDKKFKDLEDRLARLESGAQTNQISELSDDNTQLFEVDKQASVQNVSEVKENCIYFANGVKGDFLRSSSTMEFKEGKSLYRFKKTNENEALVSVVNESSVVKKFRSNPDALDGICEQLNQCDENTKAIETVEPGKAVLDGDKWRIKTVVKIKYI
jgi:hypothetical protein